MEFRVLGPVEVVANGRARSLGSARQETILAVLLAAGGDVVSVDRLIEAVWASTPPASAPKTVRAHVAKLRRELDDLEDAASGAVVTVGSGYRIELAAHEFDAAGFEQAADRAAAALQDEPARTLRLLDDALGWWRGPAYGPLADHPFVRPDAVRLEQRRAAAVGDRAEALLALGRHQDAVSAVEMRASDHPLDERLHGQLMRALYGTGRQADALMVYRRLQERLRQELGVDPSPTTQRLHEQILRHDDDLAPPARPAERAARVTQPQMPQMQSLGPLVGRDEDVAAVAALATTGRQVTLTGPGGVGKSRLAERVASEVSDQFEDGVARCALSAVRRPEDVATALGDVLGIEQAGRQAAEEAVVEALGRRAVLVVLDGCEHVLEGAAELVDAIHGRCPHVGLLVTSREPLHLPGEHVWQVAPLRPPRAEADAAGVAESPAGALFAARAEAAAPNFELTDANAGAVAEICRRLDGLPLAIELAAARVRALTPDELAARLDHRFSVLTGGPTRDKGRHRTLEAAVEWSYDLLDEPEAKLFARLSVFADTFDLVAAERVCAGPPLAENEVAGRLADLVDKSMVSVERDTDGSVRYRLLDTLRDFGARCLAAAGEVASYRGAHAAYHLSRVEEFGPQVRGAQERRAVAAIDGVINDLRTAHDWLVASGPVGEALRLPAAMHEYLLFRPRAEVFGWAERAISLPDASSHPAYPAALATAARGATVRGDVHQGRRHAEAALAKADPGSFAAVQATAAQSTVALYEGRLDDVLSQCERMVQVADAVGSDYYRSLAVLDSALALLYRGDADAARAHADDLERAAETTNNPTVSAWVRYVQGELLLDVDPAAAIRQLEAAIEIAQRGASRLPEGAALVSLASVCARHGDTDRALALFREAVQHWRLLGDHTHQVTTVRNLVALLAIVQPTADVAVLHGAVTAATPPTFGAEEERLAAAWERLESHLGAGEAAAAARQGRAMDSARLADEALRTLGALLDD